MNFDSTNQTPLHKILEDNGWHNEDNQVYPPHGTSWISGNDKLPIFMIERMYEKAKDTLQKQFENSHFFLINSNFRIVLMT
ncbi:MAG: hypothetical protein M3388_13480 [Acidobacteriota bacterium]|nr:hypothetical protein [Acidobacteriota bacterium]